MRGQIPASNIQMKRSSRQFVSTNLRPQVRLQTRSDVLAGTQTIDCVNSAMRGL